MSTYSRPAVEHVATCETHEDFIFLQISYRFLLSPSKLMPNSLAEFICVVIHYRISSLREREGLTFTFRLRRNRINCSLQFGIDLGGAHISIRRPRHDIQSETSLGVSLEAIRNRKSPSTTVT